MIFIKPNFLFPLNQILKIMYFFYLPIFIFSLKPFQIEYCLKIK